MSDGQEYGVLAFTKLIFKISRKEAMIKINQIANGGITERVFTDGKNFFVECY